MPAEAELLLDLRGVTVPDRPEGAHDTRALRMVAVLARLPPPPARAPPAVPLVAGLPRPAPALARAHLALDHDGPVPVHHAGAEERKQRQDRGSRIAARAGDPLRGADLGPVQLGNAVRPAIEDARPGVRRVVPPVVVGRIAETVVAREVDKDAREILELPAQAA